MDLRIDACSQAELAALLALETHEHLVLHHRERFALQADGAGTYLLAWHDGVNVGRCTLYARSKYEVVRAVYPRLAEINALEAFPVGRGTGTALIARAEHVAAQSGGDHVGLAVGLANSAARRLYERLGYSRWDRGPIVDEWVEHRDGGDQVHHVDTCDYLVKALG